MDILNKDFAEAQEVLNNFMADDSKLKAVAKAGEVMVASLKGGHKILSCGNGGSICDAMHFAEELTGQYRGPRPSIPAIAIADSSHLSCAANDLGFDYVFSRYIEGVGQKGDVLLAISTSGNSANILRAAETAHQKGMKVVGLTGKDGGKLSDLCDVEVCVNHYGYSDRIQEIHIKVIHSLIHFIEDKLFSDLKI